MELKLVRSQASELEADAVVVLSAEGPPRAGVRETACRALRVRRDHREAPRIHAAARRSRAIKARRVLIAGAGKREKFDAAALRKIAGAAVRFLKRQRHRYDRFRAG